MVIHTYIDICILRERMLVLKPPKHVPWLVLGSEARTVSSPVLVRTAGKARDPLRYFWLVDVNICICIYILFIFNYVYAIYLSMEIYICICNLFICENINIMFLCVKLKKTWSTLWCYNSVSSIYIYIYVLNQLFVWSFAWYLRETMEKNAKWENYAGIPWPWKIMGQLFGIWLVSCDWTTKNPTNHLQGCSPPSKFFCTPPNYRYNQQKPNS